jgi:dolichol-phosphate mannosyltransferase
MLSVVIPVFNEAESLAELYRQLRRVELDEHSDAQLVFVDDGSTDGSWQIIVRLAASDPQVLGIRFRRNFGKAAALAAGFQVARGERIVTLDGDLQDDPAEIPRLLDKLDEGFDVVSGWKQPRRDPWHKVWPSRVFNWLVSRLTGVQLHDHNCGLKAYRRPVIREVRLYGQLHRFVPVLAHARGFRVAEVSVHHRPRAHGKSKYGAGRFVQALLDLLTVTFITGYGDRPQHLLGAIGLVSFLAGAVGMLWLAVRWCASRLVESWEPLHLHETAALFYCLALCIVGAQFLSVGLLGEMIAANLARDTDNYSVAEYTESARQPDAALSEHL